MNKIILSLLITLWSICGFAQSKNFIDQPFLETSAEIDTLVVPDKIHMLIVLDEENTRNRKSTEELENLMLDVLKKLKIDIDKNLSLLDYSSDFKKYFLSGQKILKSKNYSLIAENAKEVGEIMAELERVEISNVTISKTEYSKSKELLNALKSKAILQAKLNAESMVVHLNQKIGQAIYISDLETSPLTGQLQGKVAGVQIRGMSSIFGNRATESLMIDFEKIKFSSKVHVKFILE